MLSPIARVPCWPGLQAGFELQLTLARWLCDPATTHASVAEARVKSLHPHAAVQDWLWAFLVPRADQTRLLAAAIAVASQTQAQKQRLLAWLNNVSDVSAQFQANPSQWSAPPDDLPHWDRFTELMLAFYEKLDSKGLPFDATGQPTIGRGVTYRQFVDEFKSTHSASVCVTCGGYLGKAQVDHWIWKASYPTLAIAPDNLLPICHQCNEPPGKGSQSVFALGVAEPFQDWFHPHHRSGYGCVVVQYESARLSVIAVAANAGDTIRTSNLDKLLKLSERWTREFKAEYRNKQKELRQLIAAGLLERETVAVDEELRRSLVGLVVDRANYRVHRALLECAREPARLAAWVDEL